MKPVYLSIANSCKYSIVKTCKGYKPRRMGAFIVKWYRRHENLDYSLKHMYVVKKDIGVYSRGQQLFNKPDAPYRDIYFYPKETRKALRELLLCFDIPAENQIGFTVGRGIQDLMYAKPHKDNLTRIKLDLKDAFNSITQQQIFWLLRKVFDVNKALANELSHKWTYNGHMLQGHPLAPAIFNLVTRDLNIWLSERTGIIQYADDILIYEESNYISWSWLKIIFKKFRLLGFELNVEKEGFFHRRKDLEFLGLKFTFKEEKPLISAKRKIRRQKIRRLERITNSKSPVLKGNINWFRFNPKQIVLKKIQSPNNPLFLNKSGDEKLEIAQKVAQSGGKNTDLWKLWTNPAAISCSDF